MSHEYSVTFLAAVTVYIDALSQEDATSQAEALVAATYNGLRAEDLDGEDPCIRADPSDNKYLIVEPYPKPESST